MSSDISTTITFREAEDSEQGTQGSMKAARQHLQELEDLLDRIRMVTYYMTCFDKKPKQLKICSLAEISQPLARYRGGGGNDQKPKAQPARWETTEGVQGLKMETKVTVKVGSADVSAPLPTLTVEGFATNAQGLALLTLDSWEKVKTVRSQGPLVAILPGDKRDMVAMHSAVPPNCAVVREVILAQKPRGPDGEEKKFAKTVTIINHMEDPTAAVLNIEHGGQNIKLDTAYNHQLFADYFGDTAPPTQGWNNADLKQTFEGAVAAWKTGGNYTFQWITLRYHRDTNKATVMIRADEVARKELLRHSGKNLVFVRERQVANGKTPEYVPIWLQGQETCGPPLGRVSAIAANLEKHWGLCRSLRSYGVRSDASEIEKARSLLRPTDGALNELNRKVVPSGLWVLKGVKASATPGELSHAVSGHWPVLPIRVLGMKRDKATWLIEAGCDPPSKVMHSGDSIVFVEKYKDTRQRNGPMAKKNKGQPPRPGDEGEIKQPVERQQKTSAMQPFKAQKRDPLATQDPWAGYKGASASTPAQNTDPMVLGRLRKAEEAITRIEARQDQTDKSIQSMHSSMDQRFQEVLNGLAALQGEPRRKQRNDDDRGGRTMDFAAANITTISKRWEEVATMPYALVGLTETLAHANDEDWLKKAYKGKGKTWWQGASCIQTGALRARKGGVAFVTDESVNVVPLPRTPFFQSIYDQARGHMIAVGPVAGKCRIRVVLYYGLSGQYAKNAEEISLLLDELALSPDQPTLLMGDFNVPSEHQLWDTLAAQSFWVDVHGAFMGKDVGPTCWPPNGQPSRIDYCVVNSILMASTVAATQVRNCTFPTHIPIAVSFSLKMEPIQVVTLPRTLPRRMSGTAVSYEGLEMHAETFQNQLLNGQVDMAFRHWSEFWEEWLIAHTLAEEATAGHRGRGKEPRIKKIFPHSAGKETLSALDSHLTNLLGRVRALRRMNDHTTEHTQALHAKISRQIPNVMRRFGPPRHVEQGDILRTLDEYLEELRQAERKRVAVERRAQWRARLAGKGGSEQDCGPECAR